MSNRTILYSLIAASAFAVVPAHAQDAGADDQSVREETVRLPSVEAIMAMRERLSLTDDQIGRLDDLRAESVERRSMAQAELAEMRSRLAAGQIQQSDLMAFIEDRREASGDLREEERSRLEGVLDAEQLESLQEFRTRGRSFAAGRSSARRGGRNGIRSGRGAIRSGRDVRGSRIDRARRGRDIRDDGAWRRGFRRW